MAVGRRLVESGEGVDNEQVAVGVGDHEHGVSGLESAAVPGTGGKRDESRCREPVDPRGVRMDDQSVEVARRATVCRGVPPRMSRTDRPG